MADARTFNVEDRIRELNEDPATAYARAKANGTAGDAPAPTPIGDPASSAAPAMSSAAPAPTVPTVNPNDAPAALGSGTDDIDAYAVDFKAQGDPRKLDMPKVAAPTSAGGLVGSEQNNILPDAPLQPSRAPVEAPASLGELWGAHSDSMYSDTAAAADAHLMKGWAPIVQALGLKASENPGLFNAPDPNVAARVGSMRSPSQLATDAGQGEGLPFGNMRLADQALQEQLVVDLIKRRRAQDPKFLPGVPDTLAAIHTMFNQQEKASDQATQATLERSPGGVTGAVAYGGELTGSFRDPRNWVALALPMGEAKGVVQIMARDAIVNMALNAANQPTVADHKAAIGEHYGVGDFVGSEIGAGIGGAVLGAAMHGLKVGGGSVQDSIMPKVFEAMPESVQRRWANRMSVPITVAGADGKPMQRSVRLTDILGDMSNGELAQYATHVAGNALTLDQRAAINVLQRGQDVSDTSPYQADPAGEGKHEASLAEAVKDLEDHKTPDAGGFPSVPTADGSEAASPAAATERPPAPSTVARPHRFQLSDDVTPSDPNVAIESFIPKVYHAENNTGNIHAKNPHSSASGPAQFTDGTFRDYYRKVYGTDPGEHPATELKDNPEVQHNLLLRLTHDNASRLESLREKVNAGNLYVMHVFGEGDGPKLFKADPSTPVEHVLSEHVLAANPELRGKSASEVIAWAHQKMGAHVSSVRAGADPLEAATADSSVPQLNDTALQLEPQVVMPDHPVEDWHSSPGSRAAEELASTSPIAIASAHVNGDEPIGYTPRPDGTAAPIYTQRLNVSDLNVDADRFQFKLGGDEFGVTDKLKGVQEVDPLALGRLTVWQDRAGKFWVADGHQRSGLLRRELATTGLDRPVDVAVLRETDGVSAHDAMVMAAIRNLGEDSGTAIDAAKIGRANAEALERAAKRLPPNNAVVRNGRGLMKLSDPAFGAVINQVIPEEFGAVIGHLLPHNPEAHEAMVELLAKLQPANQRQAESIIRQAIAAGIHKEEQVDLFGAHQHVTSLMLEKAKLLERVLAELRKMKLVHSTAADNAGALERTGSKIARERSAEEAQANAQAIETVNRLAHRAGPIADALTAAAHDLKSGGKLTTLARAVAEQVRKLDLAELDRGSEPDGLGSDAGAGAAADGSALAPVSDASAGDAGDGFNFDEPGRVGEAGEAGSELPPERGDQEQPGLPELEQATARFSDPNGKAAQQKSDSLFHDFKAQVAGLTRRERSIAATAALEGGAPGEFRTLEPHPDEDPGYHRFSYVTSDGHAVAGHYTLDGNLIEGLDIGDASNRSTLGPRGTRELLEQIEAAHPEVQTVHGFRKSGARVKTGSGPRDIWFKRTENGFSYSATDPRDAPGAKTLDEILAKQKGASLEDLYARAEENQPKLEELAGAIADAMPGVKLKAPRNGVKALERVQQKLADYDEPGQVKDLARASLIINTPEQADHIVAELAKRFPLWDKGAHSSVGYADRKVILQMPNGGVAELQLVPEPIADYKFGEGHDLYKITRADDTTPAEFNRATAAMKAAYEERLRGSAFEAWGKDPANSSESSSRPSVSTSRDVAREAGFQDPETNTHALLGSSETTGRSSSSKYLMDSASPLALDMGAKAEPRNSLDLGEQVDPAIADRQRQELELGANAPLRPLDPQDGTMGLHLFDHSDQPTFRIGDEGEQISAADLLKDLEDDDKAIKAIRDCL